MSFISYRPLRALALATGLGLASSACTSQLDQVPSYTANAEVVYRDPAQIQQSLVRLYATLAVSGQSGPDGQPDISGIGEDFSQYLRQYWSMQELASDEGIIAWNDGNLSDISRNTWNANNEFIRAIYDRIFYQIGLCNEFIRQTSDEKLASRGITDANAAGTIRQYRAEARFLRALSYWHALDMFGNVPFADETSALGGTPPPQIARPALFAYIESELKAIEPTLVPARTAYARADQGACQTLLTALYLNAEVYTGTARNTDAVTYANKVLSASYVLAPEYRLLFLADNDATAANREVIFTVPFDGTRTRTFGGMPFILHASLGGSVPAADFGVNGGWSGVRIKPNIVD
ncbi:MAG: RagB/SusD family nutrient uptake outer membrane protein, partial [Hymenobacter sp.]